MSAPPLTPRPAGSDVAPGTARRHVLGMLGLLGAGGAAAGLSGCGSVLAGVAGTGPSRDSLTFWNLFTGGDGSHMVEMEQKYERANPDVTLNAVPLSWGNPYYTKLILATLGNRPPDVGISHLSRLPTLARANILEPLDPAVLARHGLTADKFTGAAWRKAQVDGKQYAIPLDTHPFVMYYNTEICKKAGLLGPDGRIRTIEGTDGLVDALRACQKVTGTYGGVVNINADPSTCWRWFDTLYGQLGGQVLAADGTKIVLDDQKAEKVLRYQQELTVRRKLMPSNIDGNGVTQLFAGGKVGLLFDGNWQLPTYQATKMPFSMAPVPNVMGGTYHCFADSHSFILPRDAHRDAARLDRCLGLVRSLLEASMIWAGGGHVPAWKPVQESAAFRKLKPQSEYVAAANAAVYDPAGWYSGAGADFENIMGATVGAVEAGQIDPAAAIAQIRRKLGQFTDKPAPVGGVA
ncbi:MAG: extracellular solute-binding protein [Actinocatenispora sp.]